MSFTPQPPYGVGGNVTATTSTVNADFGAKNFPNSPNFGSSVTSTATRLLTINAENLGSTPPSNAGTT
jgi:hypothetical protein